jgi:hypothetical protein
VPVRKTHMCPASFRDCIVNQASEATAVGNASREGSLQVPGETRAIRTNKGLSKSKICPSVLCSNSGSRHLTHFFDLGNDDLAGKVGECPIEQSILDLPRLTPLQRSLSESPEHFEPRSNFIPTISSRIGLRLSLSMFPGSSIVPLAV